MWTLCLICSQNCILLLHGSIIFCCFDLASVLLYPSPDSFFCYNAVSLLSTKTNNQNRIKTLLIHSIQKKLLQFFCNTYLQTTMIKRVITGHIFQNTLEEAAMRYFLTFLAANHKFNFSKALLISSVCRR